MHCIHRQMVWTKIILINDVLVPQLLTLSVSISRIVVVINFVYERLCMWLKLCEGYFFSFFFSFFLFLSCMTIVNMFLVEGHMED